MREDAFHVLAASFDASEMKLGTKRGENDERRHVKQVRHNLYFALHSLASISFRSLLKRH